MFNEKTYRPYSFLISSNHKPSSGVCSQRSIFMNRVGRLTLLIATASSVCALLSQNAVPKPAFEVISIKPTAPGNRGRGGGPRGDRFTMAGSTLKMLLQAAYQRSTPGTVSDFQVFGGPSWINE